MECTAMPDGGQEVFAIVMGDVASPHKKMPRKLQKKQREAKCFSHLRRAAGFHQLLNNHLSIIHNKNHYCVGAVLFVRLGLLSEAEIHGSHIFPLQLLNKFKKKHFEHTCLLSLIK